MTKVNMHEAKSRLSELVEKAKKGEEIVIAKNGDPQALLIAYKKADQKDWFGMDEGKGWIAEDFDELPEDILKMMSDPKIFPDESDEDDETID